MCLTGGYLERLQALGCDELQGAYLSRPLPAGKVEAVLQHGVTDVDVENG